MKGHAAIGCIALCVAWAGCGEAPFGEVLVVVDTDVSVPRFAGRLRVDLYREDGTWYESRDVGAPDKRDWPLSFSVVDRDAGEKRVRVRLRVYPEGRRRDYRGERYHYQSTGHGRRYALKSADKWMGRIITFYRE